MSCEVFEAASNPDGNIGCFAAEEMPDDIETICRVTVYIPTNFTSVISAYLIIVPNASGNIRWSCSTNFGQICANELYTANTDNVPENTVAVTANEIECLNIAPALTNLAADDIVGVEFHRCADDVLDTIGDVVHFLGVIITICT